MKERTKRTKRALFAAAVIAGIALALIPACKDGPETAQQEQPEQPKAQSATISLFGGTHAATVQGTMTDSQWNGVAGKIETAINNNYQFYISTGSGMADRYETVFGRSVIINVEKTPPNYTKWRTTGDGKTMYLNYGKLDTDLNITLDSVIMRLLRTEADVG